MESHVGTAVNSRGMGWSFRVRAASRAAGKGVTGPPWAGEAWQAGRGKALANVRREERPGAGLLREGVLNCRRKKPTPYMEQLRFSPRDQMAVLKLRRFSLGRARPFDQIIRQPFIPG
jgi:hypothetical protein